MSAEKIQRYGRSHARGVSQIYISKLDNFLFSKLNLIYLAYILCGYILTSKQTENLQRTGSLSSFTFHSRQHIQSAQGHLVDGLI